MNAAQPPSQDDDVDQLVQIYIVERGIEAQTFSSLLTMLSASTALLTLSAFALFHAKHAVHNSLIDIYGFQIRDQTSEVGEVPGWAVALVPIPTIPFIAYTAILTYLGNARAQVVRDYEKALQKLLRASSGITPPFGQETTTLAWRRLRALIWVAFTALLGLYVGIIWVSFKDARASDPWFAWPALIGCSLVTLGLVLVLVLAFSGKRSRTNPAPDIEKLPGALLSRLLSLLAIGRRHEVELKQLEESLWRQETRFDRGHMEIILAADFFESGTSGRIHTRDEILNVPSQSIVVQLPLEDFGVHRVSSGAYLVSYVTEVTVGDEVERANRSSLWVCAAEGWKLRFHQGIRL